MHPSCCFKDLICYNSVWTCSLGQVCKGKLQNYKNKCVGRYKPVSDPSTGLSVVIEQVV